MAMPMPAMLAQLSLAAQLVVMPLEETTTDA
jgi:hypothetical protein